MLTVGKDVQGLIFEKAAENFSQIRATCRYWRTHAKALEQEENAVRLIVWQNSEHAFQLICDRDKFNELPYAVFEECCMALQKTSQVEQFLDQRTSLTPDNVHSLVLLSCERGNMIVLSYILEAEHLCPLLTEPILTMACHRLDAFLDAGPLHLLLTHYPKSPILCSPQFIGWLTAAQKNLSIQHILSTCEVWSQSPDILHALFLYALNNDKNWIALQIVEKASFSDTLLTHVRGMCERGWVSCVKRLLKRTEDSLVPFELRRCLLTACVHGHEKMVQFLIEHFGISVKTLHRPLQLALDHRQSKVVLLLCNLIDTVSEDQYQQLLFLRYWDTLSICLQRKILPKKLSLRSILKYRDSSGTFISFLILVLEQPSLWKDRWTPEDFRHLMSVYTDYPKDDSEKETLGKMLISQCKNLV